MERPTRRITGLGLTAALLALSGARVEGAEAERIAEALELQTGMTVADIGAGDGFKVVAREPGFGGDPSRYGVVFRRPLQDAVAPGVP
jgi:hypothetical protein